MSIGGRIAGGCALLMVLAPVVSCRPETSSESDAAAEAAPFDFSMVRDAGLFRRALSVHGRPSAGASVQLRSWVAGRPADVLFRGSTDAQGVARGAIQVPEAHDGVLLIVQRRGWVGPWDDEEARRQLGAFAPSVRLRLDVQALANVELELQEAR